MHVVRYCHSPGRNFPFAAIVWLDAQLPRAAIGCKPTVVRARIAIGVECQDFTMEIGVHVET
jgi:hypothetical protein